MSRSSPLPRRRSVLAVSAAAGAAAGPALAGRQRDRNGNDRHRVGPADRPEPLAVRRRFRRLMPIDLRNARARTKCSRGKPHAKVAFSERSM